MELLVRWRYCVEAVVEDAIFGLCLICVRYCCPPCGVFAVVRRKIVNWLFSSVGLCSNVFHWLRIVVKGVNLHCAAAG